jgi:hypothetical protein
MIRKLSISAILVFTIMAFVYVDNNEKGEELFPDKPKEYFSARLFVLGNFETDNEGWSASGGKIERIRKYASNGRYSLEVFPEGRVITLTKEGLPDDFVLSNVSFDVYLPPDAKGKETYISLVDDENLWHQQKKTCTLSGGWNSCRIDLYANIVPVGHYRPWSGYVSLSARAINIRFQSKTPFIPPLYIDNIRVQCKEITDRQIPLMIKELYVNKREVERYTRFETSFLLSREYKNPFDPEQVEVEGIFFAPSGKVLYVPGFFYQQYIRRLSAGKEHLIPAGTPRWLVRFAPCETGTYRYYIRVKDRHNSIETDTMKFVSIPSSNPGYVRVSSIDKRYFEFEDGSFFYPIGLNIISPWDTPYQQKYVETLPIGLGTYIYDRYIERLSANGMNFFRMWMAHWWLALEWNPDKGPFYGIGRYSLSNAWRLDHIIEQAEKNGIYILLTLNNHTQLTGHERGWEMNPYNKVNGGFLAQPAEFFTNPKAREMHRKRLRYTVGRWGYSTAVFAWDLWSEVDLTGGFNSSRVRQWHIEMAEHIKKNDPSGHMVATHFCIPSRALEWEIPDELDFIHSNSWVNVDGFSDSQADAISQYYGRMKRFGAPTFVSEYGGHWAGSDREIMLRDLHTGLWANYMTPLSGSPQFWWWNLVDEESLYFHYNALARFARGEERRNKNLQQKKGVIENDTSGNLSAILLGNDTTVYGWIYNFLTALRVSDEKMNISNARLLISDVSNGKYLIEFWNTYNGEITGSTHAVASKGVLNIALPDIEDDIACKVKLAKD